MCVMHGSTMKLSAMIDGVLTPTGHRSMVPVAIIKMMVYMAVKVLRPVKPRPCTDEYSAAKPFGTVVAVGSTVIRWYLVVSVRAHRRRPNAHSNLSWSRLVAN